MLLIHNNFIDFYNRAVADIEAFAAVIANLIRIQIARFALHAIYAFPIVKHTPIILFFVHVNTF